MENSMTNDLIVKTEIQTSYSAGSFETNVGRATYVVGVFFNEKAKASYDDKAKKLIMSDMKAGNF